MKPFFVSIPHSGEKIPEETAWLNGLPEPTLMRDVDRFVDLLYKPALDGLKLPNILAQWHRYVVDLNRLPGDVDQDSVIGSSNPSGSFATGLHWRVTTQGEVLMPNPITEELHNHLVENYFWPFHNEVELRFKKFKEEGAHKVYHLDAHSMPSMGTKAHRDPGQARPEIVVSDVDGKSCESRFMDLVVASYKAAGFEVAMNFPYKGGRVTQTYGRPDLGQHSIQVEMNRRLYMNEETKKLIPDLAEKVQKQIKMALQLIYEGL